MREIENALLAVLYLLGFFVLLMIWSIAVFCGLLGSAVTAGGIGIYRAIERFNTWLDKPFEEE